MSGKINVSSEIGRLQKVMVHRPDGGIDRISPKRAEELLFDDIVYLKKMQEEHDTFTEVLRLFLGADNVLEAEQLLLEGLEASPERKQRLIDNIAVFEELPDIHKAILEQLPNHELKNTLITGYVESEDTYLFDPIPNFIFTRDVAIMVNDHVIITKPSKTARFRENFLTRFIFWEHPMFKRLQEENKIINLNKINRFPPSRTGEPVSVEGGDVMIINKDYLLIGCSERTTARGIESLRDELFKRGVVKNVVQINIPNERYCMHIDTIFTQINHQHVVAFGPLVVDGLGSYVQVHRHTGASVEYPTIAEFLLREINENIEFILSGDGIWPYSEREQWTDGCNLVALRPGVALTYDRNVVTAKAFEKRGYTIMHADDLLRDHKAGKINIDAIENTIITLTSSELSRARGGSHCMTCPISRAEL